MGLFSPFHRRDESGAATAPTSDDVAAVRVRARRRLIGASVLLAIGVIGFPLLFETRPRPIPVDIPIEIPRKEGAAPLVLPATRPVRPAVAAAPVDPPASAVASPKAEPRAAPASGSGSAAAAARAPAAPRASAPAVAPAPAPKSVADGQRAQALLEGSEAQPAKASDPGAMRVVVQVGAYTDADKLRAARQKVEQMGMKTYTQVVEVEGMSRTRVRVGPFATRQEAEQAAARLRAAGLPVAVLVL